MQTRAEDCFTVLATSFWFRERKIFELELAQIRQNFLISEIQVVAKNSHFTKFYSIAILSFFKPFEPF